MAVHAKVQAHVESWAKYLGISYVYAISVSWSGNAWSAGIGCTVIGRRINFRLEFLRPTDVDAIVIGEIIVDAAGILIGVCGSGGGLSKVIDQVAVGRGGPIRSSGNTGGDGIHQSRRNDVAWERIANVAGAVGY